MYQYAFFQAHSTLPSSCGIYWLFGRFDTPQVVGFCACETQKVQDPDLRTPMCHRHSFAMYQSTKITLFPPVFNTKTHIFFMLDRAHDFCLFKPRTEANYEIKLCKVVGFIFHQDVHQFHMTKSIFQKLFKPFALIDSLYQSR